jgi:molybdate/tungstate transport system substrate-binding protein
MPLFRLESPLNINARAAAAACFVLLARPGRAAAQPEPTGPLVIFHAGSLAYPFRELLKAYTAKHPGVDPRPEASGSVEAARKLTELHKIPDLVGTADYAVIEQLLMPTYATWYVTFASNAVELAYTDQSAGAKEVTAANWLDVVTRPTVRIGRSNPALDPSGYRSLMVFQLAERYYHRPGLADRLLAQSPPRFMRPKEVELVALLETGEIDYVVLYRSVVRQAKLRSIALPKEIDLSDPAFAAGYSQARVAIPKSAGGPDSLVMKGEPIVYALTIPQGAANAAAASSFAKFVLSPEGRSILEQSGFVIPARPALRGDTALAARMLR